MDSWWQLFSTASKNYNMPWTQLPTPTAPKSLQDPAHHLQNPKQPKTLNDQIRWSVKKKRFSHSSEWHQSALSTRSSWKKLRQAELFLQKLAVWCYSSQSQKGAVFQQLTATLGLGEEYSTQLEVTQWILLCFLSDTLCARQPCDISSDYLIWSENSLTQHCLRHH